MRLLGVPFSFHASASGPRITLSSNTLVLSSPIESPDQRGTVSHISPLAPKESLASEHTRHSDARIFDGWRNMQPD